MEPKKKNAINPLEQSDTPLAFRFNMLAKKYYGAATQQFEGFDLERYFYVLSVIGSHEYITQQCLANCMGIDKATVVRVIDYLTEKGLVKREVNKEDRREHIIVATPRALKIIPVIKQVFDEVNKTAFRGFTKEEKMQFIKMTNKIMANLISVPVEEVQVKISRKGVKK